MRQLGPYILGERIGVGGMAEVWVAQRVALGVRKTMAVKVLAPNLAGKKKYREMFLDEARISMALGNANIVQAFDAGQVNGEFYMAMEWVDGANVAELQAALWEVGRRLPVGVTVYIAGEILRALDYAHNVVCEGATTIVHRDVSPANVLVSVAGEVKLTDFGVARFGSEETSGLHVKGKLRYMPAEQLQGKSKEGTVDLYSVGAVLHEMLDGSKFRGEDTEEGVLLGMILKGVVPELRERSVCSPQLDAVRRGLLDPDLTRRIPTAREALARLRDCPEYRSNSQELAALVRWYRGIDPQDSAYRPHRITEKVASTSRGTGTEASMTASRVAVAQAEQQAPGRRAAAGILLVGGFFVTAVSLAFAVLNFDPPGGDVDMMIASGKLELQMGLPSGERGPGERLGEDSSPGDAAALDGGEQSPPSTPGDEVDSNAVEPSRGAEAGETSTDAPEDGLIVGEEDEEPVLDSGEEDGDSDQGVGAASNSKPSSTSPVEHAKPVEVRVVAGELGFAYVKIGGRKLTVEPSGKTKLNPRGYRVYVRQDPSAPWKSFGWVKLEPGKSYTIRLQRPSKIVVSASGA